MNTTFNKPPVTQVCAGKKTTNLHELTLIQLSFKKTNH